MHGSRSSSSSSPKALAASCGSSSERAARAGRPSGGCRCWPPADPAAAAAAGLTRARCGTSSPPPLTPTQIRSTGCQGCCCVSLPCTHASVRACVHARLCSTAARAALLRTFLLRCSCEWLTACRAACTPAIATTHPPQLATGAGSARGWRSGAAGAAHAGACRATSADALLAFASPSGGGGACTRVHRALLAARAHRPAVMTSGARLAGRATCGPGHPLRPAAAQARRRRCGSRVRAPAWAASGCQHACMCTCV